MGCQVWFFAVTVMAFVASSVSAVNITHMAIKQAALRKDKLFYLELDTTLSWLDAHQFCKFHGMELAALGNKKEQLKLDNMLKKSNAVDQPLWTSGMRIGETAFYWMASGRKVIYKNWQSDFPNGAACGSYCVSTSLQVPSKWKDNNCGDKYGFVCEYYESDTL